MTLEGALRARSRSRPTARLVAALLAALLAFPALAECTPADPATVAAAERTASDADHKAELAESVAVRSGNPGAQARAKQARADASAAKAEVDRLLCKPVPAAPAVPRLLPPPGY